MEHPPTLDEWVEQNALKLRDDVRTHVEVMASPELPEDLQEDLIRLIMISVRNWEESK